LRRIEDALQVRLPDLGLLASPGPCHPAPRPSRHPSYAEGPARVRSPPAPAAPRSAQLARRADRALQLLEGVLDRPPPGQAAVVLELAELRPAFAGHPLLPHESAGGVDRPA